MIALAQSGTNIGNAGQQTAQMLQANIGSAQNQDLTNRLGDVFGGTAQAYRTAVDAKERRRGLDTANLYARAFTR
jgi:hypothetical protein